MLKILLLTTLLVLGSSVYDILSFGAVPNSDTVHDQFINAEAILKAIQAANSSQGERVVRIPNKKFYSMPIRIEYVHNITITIMGKLIASKSVKHWPLQHDNPRPYYEDFISFRKSSHIQLDGGGKIDGRGYHWWVLTLLAPNKYLRD
jgi:hypothetical protein